MTDSSYDVAAKLADEYPEIELNEADTRHRVIDEVLHSVLAWPKAQVRCEQYVSSGYADYVLYDKSDRPITIIEAKRSGTFFELPGNMVNNAKSTLIPLKRLLTSPTIRQAVDQVMKYLPEVGCNMAAITNGSAYIFFRAFVRGRSYKDLHAYVIPQLSFFAEHYTEAVNNLGYTSAMTTGFLSVKLAIESSRSMDRFAPKDRIRNYHSEVSKNKHARMLQPIAERLFTDIPHDDHEFMENCYVPATNGDRVAADFGNRLADSLTPYFEDLGVKDVADDSLGGTIGRALVEKVQSPKKERSDVIILFGGKGSGKSTFLKKLLFHRPPKKVKMWSKPVLVDLIKSPPNADALREFIWSKIVESLDADNILDGTTEDLAELFSDRYQLALRQELHGLDLESTEFYLLRNQLLTSWKNEAKYCAQRLSDYWARRGKLIIVALDNSDQLAEGGLQNISFLTAQEASSDLNCLVIISMREERYCRANNHGVLDAYYNKGYHLSSPDPRNVFVARIKYALELIARDGNTADARGIPTDGLTEDISAFFRVCDDEFKNRPGHLTEFLEKCAHGNTRLALSFFADFISSGYTNFTEILSAKHWHFAEHQVVKPMMIPDRHLYDEMRSRIPNVFQLRPAANSSHFTLIRILRLLNMSRDLFVPVDAVLEEFDFKYSALIDCEEALDRLLKQGLIEADNRLDTFCIMDVGDAPPTVSVRANSLAVTSFGKHMYERLCRCFTYLDLTSLDMSMRNERLCNDFAYSAKRERTLARQGTKEATEAKIRLRSKRVELFIDYLCAEEAYEIQEFGLSPSEHNFARNLKEAYPSQHAAVMKSLGNTS
jgi:hypothetical protein